MRPIHPMIQMSPIRLVVWVVGVGLMVLAFAGSSVKTTLPCPRRSYR